MAKAKKSKPWWRVRNIVLFIMLVIIIAISWVGFDLYRLINAPPEPTIDYRAQLTELLAPYHNNYEGENGWDDLIAALESFTEAEEVGASSYEDTCRPDGTGMPQYDYMLTGALIPDDARIEKYMLNLMEQRGCFDKLEAALNHDYCVRPWRAEGSVVEEYDNDVEWRLCAELPMSRAYVLPGRMRLAIESADDEQFVESFSLSLKLGSELLHQRLGDLSAFGEPYIRLPLTELQRRLMVAGFSHGSLDAIEDAINGFQVFPTDDCIRRNLLGVRDAVQYAYSPAGWLHPDHVAEFVDIDEGGDESTFRTALFCRFSIPDRSRIDNLIDRLERAAVASLDELPIERARDWPPSDIMQEIDALPDGWLKDHLHKVIETIALGCEKIIQRIDITRLMLAITRFKIDENRYPSSLDELLGDHLDTLPIDPIHGEGTYGYRPLQYDPTGRPYLIYSMGLDGVGGSDDDVILTPNIGE